MRGGAPPSWRAARRSAAAQTEADQARRDRRDAAQSAMAADAVEIDSTGLSLAEVVARIVALRHGLRGRRYATA